MGLISTLVGLATVGYPMLIEILMEEYGFRGCMAILGAINLHVLLGMVALHPVEWHQVKVKKAVDMETFKVLSAEEDAFLKKSSTQESVEATVSAQSKPIW